MQISQRLRHSHAPHGGGLVVARERETLSLLWFRDPNPVCLTMEAGAGGMVLEQIAARRRPQGWLRIVADCPTARKLRSRFEIRVGPREAPLLAAGLANFFVSHDCPILMLSSVLRLPLMATAWNKRRLDCEQNVGDNTWRLTLETDACSTMTTVHRSSMEGEPGGEA